MTTSQLKAAAIRRINAKKLMPYTQTKIMDADHLLSAARATIALLIFDSNYKTRNDARALLADIDEYRATNVCPVCGHDRINTAACPNHE